VAKYAAKGWRLDLRRMLGDEEMQEWNELQNLLRGVSLTQQEDTVCWRFVGVQDILNWILVYIHDIWWCGLQDGTQDLKVQGSS
jgi:hypothetical protein